MSLRQPAWDKICEFTTKPTYDLHDEYMVSVAVTKDMPKDMQTRHCIALGKLTETEARLKAARKFISQRRVTLDEQWEELANKEEELRKNFITFSKNADKCTRAKLKIAEMTAVSKTRIQENAQLLEDLQTLQETKALMETYPNIFKSLTEIIHRYDALMNARNQLETLNEYRLQELEIAKGKFSKAVGSHIVTISGLRNKVSDLHQRYETAENECLRWERFHQNATLEAMEKHKEIISVKNEIWLLYKDICQRRKTKPVHKNDYVKQLEVIKNTLGLLEVVKSKIQKSEEEKQIYSNDPTANLAMLQIKLQRSEKNLLRKRKKLITTRKELDDQWKQLDEKEKALRENFIMFDKIKDDKSIIAAKEQGIEDFLQKTEEIKQTKLYMDAKIKEYHVYEEYLDKVVEECADFTSIPEMLNRYLALLSAKNFMAQLQEKNLKSLENAKSDMGKLIEEKNFVIMGLNNQIANLQARYENANIKSLESEQLVIQIKNNAIQRMSEIDQVKTSIWNLCTHMAQGKRQPMKIKKDNLEEQIMYIKRTLTELAKVNQILKKQARLAKLKKKVGADK
nr:unnamed protein product [Callosobruchus analis]